MLSNYQLQITNMLLVIDVGNTHTVLGVFERAAHPPGEDVTGTEAARYERLVANWRVGRSEERRVGKECS